MLAVVKASNRIQNFFISFATVGSSQIKRCEGCLGLALGARMCK